NGVDDYIDIATGRSKNESKDGVPDDVKRCSKVLKMLEGDELTLRNYRLLEAASRRTKVYGGERDEYGGECEGSGRGRRGRVEELGRCEAEQGIKVTDAGWSRTYQSR